MNFFLCLSLAVFLAAVVAQPPPEDSRCSKSNESYGCQLCETTCGTLENAKGCDAKNEVGCNSGCFCNEGYARDDNGNCVPVAKC